MIESQKVGAVYELRDEVSPALRIIYENAERLAKLFGQVQKAISGINEVRLGGFTEKLGGISEKLTGITTKADGLGSAMTRSLQNVDKAFVESGRGIAGFSNKFDGIAEASRLAMDGVVGNVGRADGALSTATREAQGLGTALREAGAASRDIPRIQIGGRAIGVNSQGGGGGGRGPQHGLGAHGDPEYHKRIQTEHGARPNATGSHGAYVDAGVFGMIGVHEVAHAVESMVEGGAKLAKSQAQLEAATGNMATVAEATAAAWAETSRNLTTNVTDNLKNLQHLRNVVGSTDEAIKLLHPFTMVDTALGSIKDDSVAGGKGSKALELNAYNVARSLEQLGVTQDEEKLNSYLASITRMMVGMRGLVDGSKLYGAINNAGGSRYAWDQDFVTYGLGPLAQATNGRAGAQLYQLNRSYFQGVSTQQMAKGAEKYGLWNEDDEVWQGNAFKGMKVGSIFESDTLQKNPVKWAGDVREMMRGRGVNVDDTDAMTKVIAEATRGNKNLGAIMDELVLPKAYQALMRERKNIQDVPEDAVSILQKHDPGIAMKAFNEQFENLLTALGKPTVGQIADTLNKMASGFNGMAQFFDAHPGWANTFVGAMGGLAVGLGALAAIGLAAFAPGGLAVVALVSFAGAMAGIAIVNWDKIEQAAKAMGLSAENFHKNIADITGAFDEINTALTRFFTGLTDAIRAIPGFGRLLPAERGTEQFGPPMPPAPTPFFDPNAAPPGGFMPMAYVTGANDNSGGLENTMYRAVLRAFTDFANGVGVPGGSGSDSSGIINASYGGGEAVGSWGGDRLSEHTSRAVPSIRYGRPHGGAGGSLVDDSIAHFSGSTTFAQKSPQVMTRLMADFGLDVSQAAKIMGNIGHESMGFKAFNQIGGGSGIGWAQWTGPRNREFRAWSAANHLDPHSDEANYGFLKHELSGKYARAISVLKHGGSLEQFEGIFEGAGIKNYRSRHAYERAALEAYARRSVPIAGAPPSRTVAPGKPAAGATSASNMPPIHIALHLDKKVIARHVVKDLATAMAHPTTTGGPTGRTHYTSPGTPITDAA